MSDGNNSQAKKTTFLELINEKKIRIPKYQREYAQGRDNPRARLIREAFVDALYSSLTEENHNLELDFVFGGSENENNTFSPVDGQQRLTILFLLHWYIIFRSNNPDKALDKLKKNFEYATRTTSEAFCDKICEIEIQKLYFEQKINISEQIRSMSWFTGAMESDPTVRSMLVVIDCIREKFNNVSNYTELYKKLNSSEECPIYFYFLDTKDLLGADTGIMDLYIKMNARGVPLTDFELFKADLQKMTDDSDKRFDLLREYFLAKEQNDTLEERVRIIGKFNNEYTNFFFKLIDNGEIKEQGSQMFDIAMMNFINEIFRMNFFCAISINGISQKSYRGDNDPFKKMSGKEFTAFIESAGRKLYEKYWYDKDGKIKDIPNEFCDSIRDTLIKSLSDTIALLDFFSKHDTKLLVADENTCCYSVEELIKKLGIDPQDNNALPARESLARMAIYDFILKYPQILDSNDSKAAFDLWNRFIWKMDRNTDIKNFDEAIETLIGFRKILKECKEATCESIYNALVYKKEDESKKLVAAPALLQLEEEIIKAELITNDKKDQWENKLKEAENRYSSTGQIWFLLYLAIQEDGSYEYNTFSKALEISRKIFDESKKIENYNRTYLFERALLTITHTVDGLKYDHLPHMSKSASTTKRFVGRDFSDHLSHSYCNSSYNENRSQYEIIVSLLRKMLNEEITDIDKWDIDKWLDNYIKNFDCYGFDDWKTVLIKTDTVVKAMYGDSYQNGFEPYVLSDKKGNKYTAVYTTGNRRKDSRELFSFALSTCYPDEKYKEYSISSEDYLIDENGFPNRFFPLMTNENVQIKIGYMNGRFYYQKDTENPKEYMDETVEKFFRALESSTN